MAPSAAVPFFASAPEVEKLPDSAAHAVPLSAKGMVVATSEGADRVTDTLNVPPLSLTFCAALANATLGCGSLSLKVNVSALTMPRVALVGLPKVRVNVLLVVSN